MASADLYEAERNAEAAYLMRMYSVFERAVGSFWGQLPENNGRDELGDVILDEVGRDRLIGDDAIDFPQAIRVHRNNLVHRRIEDCRSAMTLDSATQNLLIYLDRLPATWD